MKEKLSKKENKRFKKYVKKMTGLQADLQDMRDDDDAGFGDVIAHIIKMEEHKNKFWNWLIDRHPNLEEGSFTINKIKGVRYVIKNEDD